jgi:hypothetical protein
MKTVVERITEAVRQEAECLQTGRGMEVFISRKLLGQIELQRMSPVLPGADATDCIHTLQELRAGLVENLRLLFCRRDASRHVVELIVGAVAAAGNEGTYSAFLKAPRRQ